MKSLLQRFFVWLFSEQIAKEKEAIKKEIDYLKMLSIDLSQLENRLQSKENAINKLFANMEVSADIHQNGNSWAVISIHGETADYIKFVDFSGSDLRELKAFLKNFERKKINATPAISDYLGKFKQINRRKND
jgi:hypothetical protein